MTTPFFARAKKIITTRAINLRDLLNGNARRRRHLKARAEQAMLAGKRPILVRAELASHRKIAGHPELQARIQQVREQIQQRLYWHRHP